MSYTQSVVKVVGKVKILCKYITNQVYNWQNVNKEIHIYIESFTMGDIVHS
jgi:hypothetical protein